MKKALLILIVAALGQTATAASTTGAKGPLGPIHNNGLTCFNGYAYAPDSGEYRYTEHHEVTRKNGRITASDITYVGPGGRVLAIEHMDFDNWWTVPTYRMVMPATGYEEGIRHDHSTWTMFKRDSKQAPEHSENFVIDPPMAAAAGLKILAQGHLEGLANGRNLRFKLVAAGRQAVLDLKMRKTGSILHEDRSALQLEVDLDMFLASWFVPPLKLTYDLESGQLLEFQGLGEVHNEQGMTYPVRIIYGGEMPADAGAQGAPAGRCGATSG